MVISFHFSRIKRCNTFSGGNNWVGFVNNASLPGKEYALGQNDYVSEWTADRLWRNMDGSAAGDMMYQAK